jgi:hypothetical protein
MLLHQETTDRQKETSCGPSSVQQREEELLAIATVFKGDGFTRFFLTTVTKSPSEGFSPVTMDESDR